MLTVALTGNVAAGKSTVAELFRRWGATVIDADTIVRELQQPGMPVHTAIVARFGAGILLPDSSLDRAALRAIILADAAARADLNALVHPAVLTRRALLAIEAETAGVAILINDIPLLFEIGMADEYPIVILVDAPVEERLRRMVVERHLDPAEARALIDAQWPSAQKRAQSTYVIDNDADRATLEACARRVWDDLLVRATASA
jgi:dephospho-CoA kinase